MSAKRLQINLCDEAWAAVESLSKEANEGFDAGHINYSDLINEMIISSKVDLKSLQLKHTDLRRSLRAMASRENIDLETVIKTLNELKLRPGKRQLKLTAAIEGAKDE